MEAGRTDFLHLLHALTFISSEQLCHEQYSHRYNSAGRPRHLRP